MAVYAHGWLMVHAGVAPQWDLTTTLALAGTLEQCLQGSDLAGFLRVMYSNQPEKWRDELTGYDRMRFALNTLTRIRFVQTDGSLELNSKEGTGATPPGNTAWFDAPNRQTQGTPIAFGHWSTLGLLNRADLLGIDTGCVWGGRLTAVRLSRDEREVIQVDCPRAQQPGA
jgi:bis(5'-nucleosyl)-tetraphosphatase (symmetrical)